MAKSRCLNAKVLVCIALGAALITILLFTLPYTRDTALANGGSDTVVKNEKVGPYELEVGILPGKPKVGDLHLSILVRDASSNQLITDATVMVVARGPEGATGVGPVQAVNTPESSQFYDVDIPLDMEGNWALTLDVESDQGHATLELPLEVEKSGGINLILVAAGAIAMLALGIWIWDRVSNRRERLRQRT